MCSTQHFLHKSRRWTARKKETRKSFCLLNDDHFFLRSSSKWKSKPIYCSNAVTLPWQFKTANRLGFFSTASAPTLLSKTFELGYICKSSLTCLPCEEKEKNPDLLRDIHMPTFDIFLKKKKRKQNNTKTRD